MFRWRGIIAAWNRSVTAIAQNFKRPTPYDTWNWSMASDIAKLIIIFNIAKFYRKILSEYLNILKNGKAVHTSGGKGQLA